MADDVAPTSALRLRDVLSSGYGGPPTEGARTARREYLAQLIRVQGLTLSEVADRLGVHRDTPGRWVRGTQGIYTRHRRPLADVLDIDLADLDRHETAYQAGTDLPTAAMPPMIGPEWDSHRARTLANFATVNDENETTPEVAPRLVHAWLVTDPPQTVEMEAGRRIGADLVEKVAYRVDQLRHLDDYVAGADLEKAVNREVATTAALIRDASYNDATGRQLLATFGDLCQLAGWVAADADRDGWVRHYYATGLTAAHAAGDRVLAGQLASSLAYHLANNGQASDAVLLAQSAVRGAQDAATPTTSALYLERLAWAHAVAGDADRAARTLAEVDAVYSERDPEDAPPWAYWLTPEEVDVMAGRPHDARPRLERALATYSDDTPRETALYLSWMAEAHLQAGDIDQAAATAIDVLDLIPRTASIRSNKRARHLHHQFKPYRDVSTIEDFNDRYRALTTGT